MPGQTDNATLRPLAPLEEAHLTDAHLSKILQSLLLPLCTAEFITLLTVATGELALAVQDPLDLEAIAIVAPAGALAPRVATVTEPAALPNASIYTNVSDLEDLELAHRFGIIMLPHVLLAATAAPHGLPALLRHILDKVMNPRGGVALLGAIPDTSVPLHAFLSTVAPGFINAQRLRRLIAEFAGEGVKVVSSRRRVVWLRGATVDALQRSLGTLACLAGALEGSAAPCVGLGGGGRPGALEGSAAPCVGLGGGGQPGGNSAVLGPAMRSAMAYAQPIYHGGGVGLPMEIEYLIISKVGGRFAGEPAVGGKLLTNGSGSGGLSTSK